MKTTIKSILFAFTLLLAGLYPCINVQAQTTTYSYTEQLSDGYYATVYVEIETPDARSSTKTVSKTYNINSGSNIVASFKLTASFSYPYNDTAKCTSATYATTVNDSGWSFSNCSATKSGNKATGHFIATHKILGITTEIIEKTLTITCDKNGNVS